MKLNYKKPRDFINPLLSKKNNIDSEKYEEFKKIFYQYKLDIDAQHASKQSEPNIVTNVLKPFVDALGYKTNSHSQKGQSGIDLAILKDTKPAVIFEVKKHNSSDMITCDNPNTKAFHEAVLYFMREREKGNSALFHIIITDFYHWFVFDAKDFDRYFWNDNTIRKLFNVHINPSLLDDKTAEFYKNISKAIGNIKTDFFEDETIDCAYFEVLSTKNEKDLLAIYKLLNPDSLLKEFNPNDANSLNREFYNELLYILGLEESKDGGKKVIGRSKTIQGGTLFENISNKLAQHKKKNDFEIVIKLIIIWINRILFLKLLESQIVKWSGKKDYKFLHGKKIGQYDKLEELFFDVLAKPVKQRTSNQFDYIPYLNSSLFEIHNEEQSSLTISVLSDSAEIKYYSKTIVKDENSKRKTGSTNTLAYLFDFLDAYDFGNDSSNEVTTESKALINASVLGLIFEKINGYKDGSFYTPSFITMYMVRETIQKSILEKFNAEFVGLDAKSWNELKRYCDKHSHKDEFLNTSALLIDSITICDPAVGSGHFLVSALNEIVFAKYELGLFYQKGMRLELFNDELLINLDDEWFEYTRPDSFLSSNHKLQKALFEEKQRIIENQLFGVDINSNSTQITKLRLWIELLKHSYYDNQYQLVTLPNIDINIKTGNSLVSRFGLTDDISDKNIKAEIANYKIKVKEYKENIGSKHEVMDAISEIKSTFTNGLKAHHKSIKGLDQKLIKFVKSFNYDDLPKDLKIKAFEAMHGQEDLFGADLSIGSNSESKAEMLKKIKLLNERAMELENGKIFSDAFEWRFEFPEVLDEHGNYIGFDLIVGNPPYGVKTLTPERVHLIETIGKVPDYEIYYWFIERSFQLLKPNGSVSLIIPNTLLFNVNAQSYRRSILERWTINEILDCTSFPIFSDATVRNIVISASKAKTDKFGYRQTGEINNFPALIEQLRIETVDYVLLENNQNWGLVFKLSPELISFISRIKTISKPLNEYFPNVSQGLIAYDALQGQDENTIKNRVYHSRLKIDETYKPWINGSDVTRYSVKWNGSEYIKYGKWVANPRNPIYFVGRRLLIREITNPRIFAGFTDDELYNDPAAIIVKENENGTFPLMALLGILNSKFATFFHFNASPKATKGAFPKILVGDIADFPLPKEIDELALTKLSTLAESRHFSNDLDVSQIVMLDNSIDELVYKVYDLGTDKVEIIENYFRAVMPSASVP